MLYTLRRFVTLLLVPLALLIASVTMIASPPHAAAAPLDIRCSSTVTTGCIDCNGPASSSTVCKTTGEDPIGGRNGILFKVSVILSLVASLGAVIVIIIGGFQYITAAGDARKAGDARRMIIAAVIGLAVIAGAQTIIAFVLNAIK